MSEETLTEKEVKAVLGKLPDLALLGDRIYKHEYGAYRRLDDQPLRKVRADDGS